VITGKEDYTALKRWKVYQDNCCLSRPFDDQTQDRIRLETEAVLLILARFYTGQWQWIASEVSTFEADQNPDFRQRFRVKSLLKFAHQTVSVGATETSRGIDLESLGFKPFDALHLACAESGNADVLLTTDDRMLRRANRVSSQLRVRVENPLTWLQEVTAK
jgi:predicted nucleic acid-binding protein